MARFDRGWVAFPRSVLSLTKKDPIGRSLIATLCAWANIDTSKIRNGAKVITIQKGELITSKEELAAEIGCDRKTIERKLKFFADSGIINTAKVHKGTLINVHHLSHDLSISCPNTKPSAASDTPEVCPSDAPSPVSSDAPHIQERQKQDKNNPIHLNSGIRMYARAHACKETTVEKEIATLKNNAGLIDFPQTNKNIPPIDLKELGDMWYAWLGKKRIKNAISLSECYEGISEMVDVLKGNIKLARLVFEFVSSDEKVGKLFLSPKWHSKKFGTCTFLEDVLSKIYHRRPDSLRVYEVSNSISDAEIENVAWLAM